MPVSAAQRRQRRLAQLQRRHDYLVARIDNYDPAGNPSFDIAECSALGWVIGVIETAIELGVIEELEEEAA